MRDSLTFAVGLSFISTSTRILPINNVLWVPVAVFETAYWVAWYKYRIGVRDGLSLPPLDVEDSIPHYGLLIRKITFLSRSFSQKQVNELYHVLSFLP
jgi:hypothetical protein